jgi:hypothetical protein
MLAGKLSGNAIRSSSKMTANPNKKNGHEFTALLRLVIVF